MVIISICGNIGSGKTTVINKLKHYRYNVQEEPINEIKDLLEIYYKDMSKWSFPLQVKILLEYHKIKQNYKFQNISCIIERSPFESKNIFAKLLYQQQYLSETEYNNLKAKAEKEKRTLPNQVKLILEPHMKAK